MPQHQPTEAPLRQSCRNTNQQRHPCGSRWHNVAALHGVHLLHVGCLLVHVTQGIEEGFQWRMARRGLLPHPTASTAIPHAHYPSRGGGGVCPRSPMWWTRWRSSSWQCTTWRRGIFSTRRHASRLWEAVCSHTAANTWRAPSSSNLPWRRLSPESPISRRANNDGMVVVVVIGVRDCMPRHAHIDAIC
jgi:hypothetical protein